METGRLVELLDTKGIPMNPELVNTSERSGDYAHVYRLIITKGEIITREINTRITEHRFERFYLEMIFGKPPRTFSPHSFLLARQMFFTFEDDKIIKYSCETNKISETVGIKDRIEGLAAHRRRVFFWTAGRFFELFGDGSTREFSLPFTFKTVPIIIGVSVFDGSSPLSPKVIFQSASSEIAVCTLTPQGLSYQPTRPMKGWVIGGEGPAIFTVQYGKNGNKKRRLIAYMNGGKRVAATMNLPDGESLIGFVRNSTIYFQDIKSKQIFIFDPNNPTRLTSRGKGLLVNSLNGFLRDSV